MPLRSNLVNIETMNKPLNKYSGSIGNFIMVIGVLHLITGFVENWSVAIEIMGSGIINTVDETPERFGFFGLK